MKFFLARYLTEHGLLRIISSLFCERATLYGFYDNLVIMIDVSAMVFTTLSLTHAYVLFFVNHLISLELLTYKYLVKSAPCHELKVYGEVVCLKYLLYSKLVMSRNLVSIRKPSHFFTKSASIRNIKSPCTRLSRRKRVPSTVVGYSNCAKTCFTSSTAVYPTRI